MSDTRLERDSMGEMPVPAQALYGASTQRAVLNFPISNEPVESGVVHAFGLIKWAAARVNGELGHIPADKTPLIEQAAREVYEGKLDDQFPVDVYQTGSGTSTNMNANEVIANRCAQIAGVEIDADREKKPVHPNDHVNQGQSSNDTFPTAMHIAAGVALKEDLIPTLEGLQDSLQSKALEFHDILKIGRTHLMDATPVRLGQEFGGYAMQLTRATDRAHKALKAIHELALGGTAVGTGLNCHPDFPPRAIAFIAEKTGIEFREAENHFEAQSSKDALLECHGHLNTIAASLYKIANDIRLLSSGPRCSIGEISLPATQPGSSIMPGKVNPVMSEAVTMVAARVFGNHSTVTWCGANGHFELNVMMPVMAKCVMESIRLLTNVCGIFREKCVEGIEAQVERCNELIEYSLSMVTSLAPVIGYDKASNIAKESVESGRTVRELCSERLEELGLTEDQLNSALDAGKMAGD
ncbi:MAG TPA: aspartate ammonia-lyase [Verrucomicrobiales bacterium]|nr:aspartate ammonia-lyase [Roseibacillus sp.]HBM77623.1 aspartate ammonia-lyase [Verrucomicrobiales bacterium]HCQ39011.1 aspartate ammonia-lyase [Verrucomicrobiales bacterium]